MQFETVSENTLEAVIARLSSPTFTSTTDTPTEADAESWIALPIADILHEENARLDIKPKVFMTVLRHAVTGMKVCSFIWYLS